MNESDIELIHGTIVYRDDRHVVRLKASDERIVIVVHPVNDDGYEHTPGAYLDGDNCLVLKRKEG